MDILHRKHSDHCSHNIVIHIIVSQLLCHVTFACDLCTRITNACQTHGLTKNTFARQKWLYGRGSIDTALLTRLNRQTLLKKA